jgi:hypothetical protein
MSVSLYIVDYSEKAIALFGETKPYKNKITELGGKFNPSLKVENSEDRKAGWIFPKSKRKSVEQLINDIDNGTVQPMSGEEEKTYSKTPSTSQSSSSTSFTGVSKQDFMNLLSKVERLEQEVNNLKSMLNGGNTTVKPSPIKKQKIPEPSDEDEQKSDNEEEERPKGRIMKKK